MIIGIGTDLIEINRVVKACKRVAFRKKLYTVNEIEWFGENYVKAADNFAVKEAVAKAMGVGFGSECWPNEIEVLRDSLGKPFVKLYGKTAETSDKLGITKWHVTITNTKEYASVFAVAERE